MERDCESELSKLNIEQNACIYHFGASVIHGQRSNILRLQLVKGEKYVAPLYNYLLSKNGDIYISDVDCQKVHVLGTPEELQAFIDI